MYTTHQNLDVGIFQLHLSRQHLSYLKNLQNQRPKGLWHYITLAAKFFHVVLFHEDIMQHEHFSERHFHFSWTWNLVSVWRLFEGCLEGFWKVSDWCLLGIKRVSGGCGTKIILDPKFVWTPFFWTRVCFVNQIFLDPTFYGPNIFLNKNLFRSSIFLDKFFFYRKSFGPNIFLNLKFLDPRFFGPLIFLNTNLFLDKNICWTLIFLTLNLFGSKYFRINNFSGPTLFWYK